MRGSQLAQYLLNSSNVNTELGDSYWNDVLLLLRLDQNTNSKGLPGFKDYSKYQYQVRDIIGSDINSTISFVENGNENYPEITITSGVNILSFCDINNKLNHNLRISQLNSSGNNTVYRPTYLEVMYNGNPAFSLGTNDFTIELSFCADEVNLPWAYQTLFANGECLVGGLNGGLSSNINTYITPFNGGGYGLFIRNGSLVFVAQGQLHTLATGLVKKTWYHVAVQRISNRLQCFINFNRVSDQAFTRNLTFQYDSAYTGNSRLSIGAATAMRSFFSGTQTFIHDRPIIDTSFSGQLSNFRITTQPRYTQSFYGGVLPHKIASVENKIDVNYTDVLVNLPLNYDLYDYSTKKAHILNETLLSQVLDYDTGYLYLDGVNIYRTKNIATSLNSNEWTLEFYITPGFNSKGIKYEGAEGNNRNNRTTFRDFLFNYNVPAIANYQLIRKIPLISLISDNKVSAQVCLNWRATTRVGSYMSFEASSDGITFVTPPSEGGIFWGSEALPNSEVKFFGQIFPIIDGITSADNVKIAGAYDEPATHVAIMRYNNLLYFLINGTVVKTIPFTYSIYQAGTNLQLQLNGIYDPIYATEPGTLTGGLVSPGVKGVKLTNKAIYNTTGTNDFFYNHSLQPLPLTTDVLAPPRVRLLAIIRNNTAPSISSDEVKWTAFFNGPVSNVVLADFSLTQLNGITGSSLVSVTKLSDFEYEILANTGTGNGTLTLNFIDRHTVTYKDTNTKISYNSGELSFTGETYTVNKKAPIPILTSGASPYISAPFIVTITFDSAIETFDGTKLGVVNGIVSNISAVDEINHIYNATITPVRQGAVIVQAVSGLGTTDTSVYSLNSEPLVRIYSESFAILQLPLDVSNSINDLSPARITLNEVIANNTQFSNTIAPLGATSSLEVNPLVEQSGLNYLNFNSVASTYDLAQTNDWTLEFFLRINSSVGKTAHIFSVENGQTGFALVATNGNLIIQRSLTNTTNLFPSITFSEKDTSIYPTWNDSGYTLLQKYPHFAITKRGNVYRFYRNGIRVGIVQTTVNIDITKGDLYVGYYPNRVNDTTYHLSNVRFTLGKAIYTSYNINVPGLPYPVLTNITDETSLLSFISIGSNNYTSNKANIDNKIILNFNSIITLVGLPAVTILGREAIVTKLDYNAYTAYVTVTEDDVDGEVPFSIDITGQPSIPDKTFTSTTNSSRVFVDTSPITAAITTNDPDDNRYSIIGVISFSEEPASFNLDDLTTSNCALSNLYKYPNEFTYSFTITALETGTIEVQLEANKLQDMVGNFNLASTTFSRHCEVPEYIPDAHWSNVLLLLQSTGSNIIDSSDINTSITTTNVALTNEVTPPGIGKSMFFNGQNSSLQFTLNQTLNKTIPYTIEFYVYMKSSVVFRLPKPTILPASNVSPTGFTANWQSVDTANAYKVDVALDSGFTQFIPGYKNAITTDLSLPIANDDLLPGVPIGEFTEYVGDKGFVGQWQYRGDNQGFIVDVALDTNFTKKLYAFNGKYVNTNFLNVGNIDSTIKQLPNPESTPDIDPTPYIAGEGVILTGLIGNTSYPQLMYFLEEDTVRLYETSSYSNPAIAEDIDVQRWMHIAIVNTEKYTKLYVDGVLQNKMRNIGFTENFNLGYAVGHFYGYMQGLRITKGVARYTKDFDAPTLPFSMS